MADSNTSSLDIQELLRMVWRRKLLLIIPWGIAIVGGVLAAVLLRPVYFSNVTLVMDRGQQLGGRLGEMVPGGRVQDQADIMREQVGSSVFLRSVITAAGLMDDPETRAWAGENAPRGTGLSGDDAAEAYLVGYLQDAVSVRRGRGAVIDVTVADYLPGRAQRVADAVAEQFVLSSKAAQLDALREMNQFTLEQQEVYKERLEGSERRLEGARRAGITGTLSGSAVDAGNVSRVRSLLEQAQLEVSEQSRRVEELRGRLSGKIQDNDPQLLNSPSVNSLIAQIASLERQLAGAMLEGSGGNESSVRVLLARKTAELEAGLSSNAGLNLPSLSVETRQTLVRYRLAGADLGARQARYDYLASQISGYERQAVLSPDRELEIQRLQTQVDNDRAMYNSFLQQSAAAQIAEAFANAKVSGRFSVLEPANLPLKPGKPNRMMLVLLAVLAGGVVGIGAVMVVEHHDQSVKDADEVENLLGLPVLGVVPRVDELDRSRRKRPTVGGAPGLPESRDQGLLHRLKVESPLGLEFRRIFLKLAKTRGRTLPRTIMVTSATRGEGKTTTSASLAITLARELREKTLLVDFDLRSPKLHRALGLPGSSWGLAQMLQQRHFDERFVRSTVIPELDFLGAGKSERPAAELLDSQSVEWFLQEARARYPLVLIDAAPNLAVPDPLIIGRAVEGVIYVIRAGSTIRKAAEYGVKVQREACDNVIGVLMNDLGEVLAQYYGYRYNAYGYEGEVAGGDH
jgi:capsular exopolysaccharide synthesis family protein